MRITIFKSFLDYSKQKDIVRRTAKKRVVDMIKNWMVIEVYINSKKWDKFLWYIWLKDIYELIKTNENYDNRKKQIIQRKWEDWKKQEKEDREYKKILSLCFWKTKAKIRRKDMKEDRQEDI